MQAAETKEALAAATAAAAQCRELRDVFGRGGVQHYQLEAVVRDLSAYAGAGHCLFLCEFVESEFEL